MSHELSFDGDSDGAPCIEKDPSPENFIFDASSHIPTTHDFEVDEVVEVKKPVKSSGPDLNKIHNLHDEISGLLSPKVSETEMTTELEPTKPSEPSQGSSESDSDRRSVYVGNVEYLTTVHDLSQHFSTCGVINRITIGSHKATGRPKGFAYIEFADRESVMSAIALNDTLFKGRMLKVIPKRTNLPGLSTTSRFPTRGRGRASSRSGRSLFRQGRGRSVGKKGSSIVNPYVPY